MKPISEMQDKEFEKYLQSIKPHLPIWKQDGAVVQELRDDLFVDRNFNMAWVSTVYWVDKKGKKHSSVANVRWI